MPKKQVKMTAKPQNRETANTEIRLDQFVELGKTVKGATKRLTLDIPEDLHRRIKAHCAMSGVKMVEEITALLSRHFLIDE